MRRARANSSRTIAIVYGSAPVEQAALQASKPALTAPGDLWQQAVLKILEVIGLAEEIGLVRRHDVDQMDGFRFEPVLIEQKVAIASSVAWPVARRRRAGGPRACSLGRRHLDAAVVVDVARQAIEISLLRRSIADGPLPAVLPILLNTPQHRTPNAEQSLTNAQPAIWRGSGFSIARSVS